MQGTVVWRFCLYMFLLLSLNAVLCPEAQHTVWFQPDTEYTYKYEGFTHIKDVALIKVSAQLLIAPVLSGNESQRCRLKVAGYNIRVNQEGTEYSPDMNGLDLSRSMTFDMTGNGEIRRVFYDKDEDAVSLTLKKIILGTLSSKLVVSDTNKAARSRWAYRVNETGHEGSHSAVYHAKPLDEEIVFTKVKQTKALENADQDHTKIIRLDTTKHIPIKIVTKESFHSPNELAQSYQPTNPESKDTLESGNAQLSLPKMGGTSTSLMMFIRAEPMTLTRTDNAGEDHQSDMRNGTLKVEPIPLTKLRLADIQREINGNMSCIVKARAAETHTGLPCFRQLVTILKRLSREDIDTLTVKYLQKTQSEVVRQTMIDALGTAHTADCYTVMMQHVFHTKRPEANLLMRALFQLVDLSAPTPEIVFSSLEYVVFHHSYAFMDEEETQQVNDRATLVLASVAKKVQHSRSKWASSVVQRLEQRVGVHDPYHHRQLRSTMTEKELYNHVNWKTLHIHALGNAASDSSLGHLMSYMNDSNTHITLRSSAVDALAKYNHKYIADVLLSVALTDQEENVRLAAINGYKRHPYGGDIRALLDPIYARSHNLTQVEHRRMKRSLSDSLSRIWKGFKFRLESPSVNWVKNVGGSKLGASMGVIVKNLLDIQIRPLQGHLKVDVLDTAFATVHIGIIGFDFDMFRAELCFKGGIEYGLNILKEYNYEEIQKFAELYKKVVNTVIKTIKDAVKSFKSLVSTFKNTDFSDIIKHLIESVKQLPRNVLNLRRIGKRIYKAIGKFVELPPVVTQVKNLVAKVTTLFNDIKTDVMTLYNAIADSINTVVPWAWKEIKVSFNGIIKAIKKLLKNPQSAIQEIGEAIARIAAAIAGVIDAKHKIEEANFFAKENRPYWFDIKTELKDIWERVKTIKNSIVDTVTGLESDPSTDNFAKRFTGVDLAKMKSIALEEIKKVLEEELVETLGYLRQLLEPFQQAYDVFTQTVKNIKEAWRVIKNGYQDARTLLQEIFGPKMHEDFPRKLLESPSCGDGFWETDGKGHYSHKGIMIEVATGQLVVAPYGGQLRKTGSRQISIAVNDMKNVTIVIDNVDLNVVEKEVAAGETVGQGTKPSWCVEPHIHVSMVKRGTGSSIDPTGYLRKRKMPPPRWVQECDHYVLRWLGDTVSQGTVLGLTRQDDTTPAIDGTTEDLDADAIEDSDRKKRGTSELIDKINDFAKSLGLPDMTKLKDVFNFNMNTITLNKVLGYLDKVGLSKLKTKIVNILKEVEKRTNHQSCINPETMDDTELKQALVMRGQSANGARQTLVNRYLTSDPKCFDIGSRVGENVYCRFDETCTSVSCCVDLKLFIYRHTLTAFVRYDPCDLELTLGFNKWTASFKVLEEDFTTEDSVELSNDINALNVIQLMLNFKIQRTGNELKISLGVAWCSTRSEECMSHVVIMADAKIEIGPCVSNVTLPVLTRPADTPSVDKMLNMRIGDVIKLVDVSGIDEKQMVELVEDLREAFQQWLTKQIEDLVVKVFGNEFERFDICTTGLQKNFGPYYIEIYRLNPPIMIPVGPIILTFVFGVDGHYGATFYCRLCIMTMKASATIVPRLGSSVWGSVGVTVFVLRAELRLTGYLLTTSFPTTVTVEFKKFPLEVRARMDLNLIPLRLELRAMLIFRFCIYIPWKGKKCWEKKLINVLLWHYQTRAINKNLLNYNDAERDLTAPDFGWYKQAKCDNCEDSSSGGDDDTSGARRRRRSIGPSSPGCHVVQIEGRDYTEPAFNIEFAVADDRSEVELSYCAGTFSGGCDVINNEPLGAGSTVVVRRMVHSIRLYFRVKAKNSMGLSAMTSCELPTYDMTLPEGRITADFSSTSHPELLQGSALALDDSVIVTQKISAGYGKGYHGSQLINWQSVASVKAASSVDTGDDPLGLRLLEHFTAPREGRLVATPLKTTHYQYAEACARDCLTYPATLCLSFNYDYDDDGVCQLLNHVEGHNIYVRLSGRFHHFERRGIGHVTSAKFTQLKLAHNTTAYLNYYLRNVLGYKNIISSSGVLVDLTPPSPGVIRNEAADNFTHDACKNYVPKLWQQRCAPETTHPTHRTIVDGEGSLTVFNGHEPAVDQQFTRANRMIAANWDGIYDSETGILTYTWAVGTSPCGDDIVTHNDPHEHIASASEWTNVGLAFPLQLSDNKYYVTVRAISNIEFGPLALTVCHAQPFAIDTTPPIIYAIYDVKYDVDRLLISFLVNATDPVSGISGGEVGFGRSRRDTYLLPWRTVQNYSHVEYNFRIPDGKPAWVKMRVTNGVGLSTVGHSDRAIIVDMSPPLPGFVYDGNERHRNITFQSSSTRYCAYWHGFRDPDSGISKYVFELGTGPGSDDVVANTRLSYNVTSHCVDGLQLQHKRVYYSSVTAFNGGLVEKNVTVHSDGVYVDVTPPLKGAVKDGKDPNIDEKYSSETSTVASTWQQFSDPESGIKGYHVDVYRKPAGTNSEEFIIYTKENLQPPVSSMVRHHFHLHHGDFVRVDVTSTNKADSTTSATSDGLKIDLTEAKMSQLVDGGDVAYDMQYTDSTTTLTASWSFVDPESGIDHFKITAYELHGGKWTLIYPTSAHWKTVPGSATTWTTDEVLTLKIGARYKMRVSAVNGAGLTAVHYTNGVLVDPTPPKMIFVHAGVLLGESEELVDGYVIHNDENGIQASWAGRDVESGVKEYYVGVGTAQGKTDTLEFRSMGLSKDGYIDNVNLALTDVSMNSPIYYITVKALNRAGKESTVLSSSPIKVVPGDKAGVVRDGPDTLVDIDYQLDLSTVTVTFSGYESERDGVTRYEWAVGSAPRLDDVMPYSYVNMVTDDGGASGMLGIVGSGKGQSQLVLSAGESYYTSVRAVTGAGGILESTSDGFVVDVTAPSVVVTSVAATTFNTTDSQAVVLYQKESESYTAAWQVNDQESGIADVWFHLGTYPDADDVRASTLVSNITSFPNGYVTPRANGLPNILSLDAMNGVGLMTTRVSPVLIVDISPPRQGMVNCPKFVQGRDSLECSWSGFVEHESEVDYYNLGVGKAEGDDSVYVFHRIEAGTTSHRATGMINGGLKHKETYFVTVIAVNKVGLKTVAFSKPLVVDDTPPRGGLVVELSDTRIIPAGGSLDIKSNETQTNKRAVLAQNDAICQRALTQVIVAWEPFEDTETEVTRYQVAIGSTPGGTQLCPFEDVKVGELSAVVRGLDLSRERHVFATIKGFNAAGLYSTATSDGVYVSLLSSGKTPLGESYVYDGSDKNKDVDFQDHNEGLSAHWDFGGDPCPIEKYEWAIRRFDGLVVLNMTQLPADVTEAEADELPLKDGESYFVMIRATNKLGYVNTIHSNGVTVKLEPLLPGNVRDGDIVGKDLNFQQSITSISANWDGFGQSSVQNNEPVFKQVNNVDGNIGKHQEIDHYEVAVGTDRRFQGTKTNIRPFTNVGLNLTWTFSHLKLVPHTATYYVTVRAHSVSSAVVDVTSNGIKVGYGSPVISTGTLEIAKYVHSTTDLSFSWSGFQFVLPIKFYVWGLGNADSRLSSLNCISMVRTEEDRSVVHNVNYSRLFDVKPLTSVNLDTYIKQTGLNLTQGKAYHVIVIATDEAGGCVDTSGVFTVDTTPPQDGHLGVGPENDMKLLYSSSADTLVTWWTGFSDPESGIKSMKIRLLDGGDSCEPHYINDMTTVVDLTEISANSSSYEFAHLKLKESDTYFVELVVTNGAELTRSALSRPILLDIVSPTAGDVKNGDNFNVHMTYQSAVAEMQGVFLYLPTASGAACPRRMYSMSRPDSHWTPLVHKYLRGLGPQREKQDGVAFQDFQLSYTEQGMGVTLRRDVKTHQMLAGAVQTGADINKGATYSFEIQAASGSLRAVTSVVFFDGPKGVFADYTPILFDGDTARLADSGWHSNGMRIIDDGLPGDTSLNVPVVEVRERRGFGFQIHPNTTYEGQLSDWIVLWSTTLNGTMRTVTDLDINPTEDSHVYKLVVTGQDTEVDELENWELKLYVDGRQVALLAGTTSVSERTQITLGVYNRHGWVSPLEDVFHPPETTAIFRHLEFPAESTELCRFGDPFRGSARPIVEFQVAVGTTANAADVLPFQMIMQPCIPCQHACDQFICNKTCRADETQVVHVKCTGLSMDPIQPGAATNESQLQPYYITVKAISGSGRSVIASSGGVYIDTTPPVFELIFHVDLSWSQSEPSTFQGDNSSIAVYYEVFDKESKVVETWWAIGSTPGGADVQPLVSIGTAAFAKNKSLEGLLLENQTYYVTLVSVNGAGLTTTNTSQGVTILTMPPSADNITTVTEDTEPFDKTSSSVPAVKTSRQDSVGVAWTKPPDEEHIDGVYLSVGSEDGKADIYPEQQVGVGEASGQATLSSGGLTYTGGNETILSDTNNGRRKRDLTGEFYMEPGRTVRIHLRACSKAHICSRMPVKPMLIVRDADTVAKTEGGQLIMTLENPAAPNSRIIVRATEFQKDNTMLVGGFLSIDDVNSLYMSAASDTFKTFIADPESTQDKTDRFLRNRLHHWEGQPVFISTLPDQTIDGPLSITMPFDKTRKQDFKQHILPRILRWCADEEMWIDAGRTCDTDGGNSHIDWENGLLTVKVCHNSTVCNRDVKDGRGNRAFGDVVTTGVAEYAVVGVNTTFSNSPPVIESGMKISVDEDTHFEFTIRATDPDGDGLVFLLNPTARSPSGNATLSIDGKFSYTPCANCKGEDKIHFTVMEKRTDYAASPLSVDGTLIVEIRDSNDVPILHMFKEGRDIVPPSSAVTVTVEEDKDMFFFIAAHDVDLADDLAVAFESPRHGTLTVFNQIKKVDLIPHDCSQSWDTRRHLWDKLVEAVTGSAAIQKVSLPNPCDTNFVNSQLVWAITAFQYVPFEHYFGEDTIKVTATDLISQDLLTIDVIVLRNDCVNVSDPYCTSANNKSAVVVAGEWGAWTMWSDCSEPCGRGEQTRRRKCNDPPPMNGGRYCIGSSRETLQCTCDTEFDADAACTRLMVVGSHPGYFVDRCNCSRFYVCMRLETGWKAIRQSCPRCLLWSSSSLTCGIIVEGCLYNVANGTNNTPSSGGGESKVTGLVGTATTTSTIPPSVPGSLKEITCVDFESGWNGMQATRGIYIGAKDVSIKPDTKFGHSADFDGMSSKFWIPRFMNSYSVFDKFGISFWYKRRDLSTSVQGLVNNGDCDVEPSILITSSKDSLGVIFATSDSTPINYNDIPAPMYEWHHVVLSYNGKRLSVYVDTVETVLGATDGHIIEKHCPLVIGHTNSPGGGYFKGYMDKLCFYDRGLTTLEVSALYHTK